MDIYEIIALEHPAAAERYFNRIETKAQLLVTQPRMGTRRSDIRPLMRMLVEIVRIVDGRRDLTSLF
jgi:toxin ParE1/3/4